mmetsp:Transcript_10875/g.19714  ORF Transcript_10875/g.19714 Transcript_10875/m.19714 type:complete len:251 (+) Transcript_10875:2305-3057(+)
MMHQGVLGPFRPNPVRIEFAPLSNLCDFTARNECPYRFHEQHLALHCRTGVAGCRGVPDIHDPELHVWRKQHLVCFLEYAPPCDVSRRESTILIHCSHALQAANLKEHIAVAFEDRPVRGCGGKGRPMKDSITLIQVYDSAGIWQHHAAVHESLEWPLITGNARICIESVSKFSDVACVLLQPLVVVSCESIVHLVVQKCVLRIDFYELSTSTQGILNQRFVVMRILLHHTVDRFCDRWIAPCDEVSEVP